MSDEAERARLSRLERRLPPPRPTARNPMFLGKVTSAAPAVGKFMNVLPLQLLGTETEGSAGSATAQGSTPYPVYLVGPGVPATNDEVVATYVDFRWEAMRGVGSSPPPPPPPPFVVLPGCNCTALPVTLSMTTNASPFCVPSDFIPTTITYGPTPSVFSGLSLGASCYISNGNFLDPFTGLNYEVVISCGGNNFTISRVYYPSGGGSAFHDPAEFTWDVTASPNSCGSGSLSLTSGTIYPGGDNRCHVLVTG